MLRGVNWSLVSDVARVKQSIIRPKTSIIKALKFSLFFLASLFILYFFPLSFLYIQLFLDFPRSFASCTSRNALWGSCVDLYRFLSADVSSGLEVRPSSVITAKTLSPTSLNTKFALPHSLVAISIPRTSSPEKQQLIFVTELGVSDLIPIFMYTTDFWSVWLYMLVSGGIR
jgi:hypothetical protein